ncbi:ArsR/SmtB family transcription factor [Agrobacterium rubi]|uniref:Winged helix-turn-helix transcriptional regulator n=1 Tax=Agrobacterium rubi TaxID=28099 RepID=A0AAE7R4K9_9HYPH|nr:metalloregulator ArsR/SmtB family transcription factor [Agrobacterium rubi]NTE87847.1 winged helix-turn-helix transcriptional regulator [Agrobacterium rubi]NTF05155.1 winged helix-turn-helix transcriptional regulator [Agrobacterium rubi]NTF37940.1 winged helix-turn-helix transcriptional regulator [Agrobacterium rubi]OCJ54190.1 hypothetical protein A6U92_22965 [Agrobacterium rubi]QTG01800.1 winged helix-turn-helix transcriptional regulator [Agrobacterium rubi]
MYSNASKARLLMKLANAARLEILEITSERETSVNELAVRLDMSQSAVSQHLARLRAGGLVTTRRDAQTVYYHCENSGVHRVLEILNEIFSPEFDAANGAILIGSASSLPKTLFGKGR